MEQKIISREYISITKCDLMDDGAWKATNTVYDRVLRDGETEWIEEKADAMAMDDKPDEAIKIAMNSVMRYLIENIYQNGFKSLVEYREYKRKFEEGKKASQNDSKAQSI